MEDAGAIKTCVSSMYSFPRRHKLPRLSTALVAGCFLLVVFYLVKMRPVSNDLSVYKIPRGPRHGPRDLMLFSYMRSGSTVMGSLLRDSPGTFYVFEPLISVLPFHYVTETHVCNMSVLLCRSDEGGHDIGNAVLKVLHHIYTCSIRNLPGKTLTRILAEADKSSPPWLQLRQCLESATSEPMRHSCFEAIEYSCRNASSVVTKVLRFSFSMTETLIRSFPALQVLFLTRDPRAIVNSRIETDWFPVYKTKPETVFDNINSLCFQMKNDLRSYRKLKTTYASRVYLASVETLLDRKEHLESVHHLMNKTITATDKALIDKIIETNNRERITEKWKSNLEPVYSKYAEKHCKSVINDTSIVLNKE